MASLMPQGKQRYTDNNGNNLAGGKLYTYASGTSTPLATYSDQAGAVPNANPVVLNARGEATIFWGSAPYKVALKDASDVEIWTQDNLQASIGAADLASTAANKGASLVGIEDSGGRFTGDTVEEALAEVVTLAQLAATTGSSLVGTIGAGTGKVARTVESKLRDVVSVFDYMTPTEIAATQNASQTAVNHATAITTALQNGKRVYFPDGTYYMGSLISNQVAVNCSTFGDDLAVFTGPNVEFRCTSDTGICTFFRFDQNNNLFFGDAKFYDYGRTTVDQDNGTLDGASAIDIVGTGVAWGNITIGHIRCDLMIACLRTFSTDSSYYSARVTNIKVASIHAEDCYYGYNAQQNGDIVRIGQIYARAAFRAYFVYGVSDHEARVVTRANRASTGTINISRFGLNNTYGIKVHYSADGETAAHTHVNVNHVGPDTGIVAGVELFLDIRDGSGQSNNAVRIVTYDMSGGSETGASLANSVGIKIKGTASGTTGVVTTAAYTTTQIGGVEVNSLLPADNATLNTFRGAQSSNSYTPSWTAASVNPTLGNGTITGSYQVINGVCYCSIDLTWGSGTSGGTGVWSFSLPVTPAMSTVLGQGRITDAGANFLLCAAFIVGSTLQVYSHTAAAAAQATVPITWTTNDRLVLSIAYPV